MSEFDTAGSEKPNGIASLREVLLAGLGKHRLLTTALILALCLTVLLALGAGRYPVPFASVLAILIDNLLPQSISPLTRWDPVDEKVVELVRLPRILVAGLCGMCLSISGAALQGIFRNPLVGPQIIGVSSGAAFGGALAILMMISSYYIPVFAFGFGVVALILTMALASAGGGKSVLSLVLGGIVTSAFFASLVSLAKYSADPDDSLPTIVYWLLGSFNESGYRDVLLVLVPTLLAGGLLLKMRHLINLLSLGDEEAGAMGVNVSMIRWIILLCCALLTAATVSVSGIVGWVGLIIPHFARMLAGPNHSRLLLTSMLVGAIYMISIDTVARTASYGEIPIGVLTALIGAPVFGWLLFRTQKRGWGDD